MTKENKYLMVTCCVASQVVMETATEMISDRILVGLVKNKANMFIRELDKELGDNIERMYLAGEDQAQDLVDAYHRLGEYISGLAPDEALHKINQITGAYGDMLCEECQEVECEC